MARRRPAARGASALTPNIGHGQGRAQPRPATQKHIAARRCCCRCRCRWRCLSGPLRLHGTNLARPLSCCFGSLPFCPTPTPDPTSPAAWLPRCRPQVPSYTLPPAGFKIHAEIMVDVPVEHGLLMENLLDLAHAPFTHTSTFARGWPVPDFVKFHASKVLSGNWDPYPIDMAFHPPCMVRGVCAVAGRWRWRCGGVGWVGGGRHRARRVARRLSEPGESRAWPRGASLSLGLSFGLCDPPVAALAAAYAFGSDVAPDPRAPPAPPPPTPAGGVPDRSGAARQDHARRDGVPVQEPPAPAARVHAVQARPHAPAVPHEPGLPALAGARALYRPRLEERSQPGEEPPTRPGRGRGQASQPGRDPGTPPACVYAAAGGGGAQQQQGGAGNVRWAGVASAAAAAAAAPPDAPHRPLQPATAADLQPSSALPPPRPLQVLGEDLVLVLGQQDRMQRGGNTWSMPVAYDKLAVRYRRWRNAVATGELAPGDAAGAHRMTAGEMFSDTEEEL